MQFYEHDFEKYYPKIYEKQIAEILATKDRQQKRDKKRELIIELLEWSKKDESVTRSAFLESARDVLEILNTIHDNLVGQKIDFET